MNCLHTREQSILLVRLVARVLEGSSFNFITLGSMGRYLAYLISFWALVGIAQAHIHSRRVSNLKKSELNLSTWVFALVSSALVGACGILPLLFNRWIRLDSGCRDQIAFRVMLSFSVGGLLGDVFLHLLPESYGSVSESGREAIPQRVRIGLWVLAGALVFLMVEKMMTLVQYDGGDELSSLHGGELAKENVPNLFDVSTSREWLTLPRNTNCNCNILEYIESSSGSVKETWSSANSKKGKTIHPPPQLQQNMFTSLLSYMLRFSSAPSTSSSPSPTPSRWMDKDASGYLNLMANCTDNFTHGLAIAAGYVVSPAVGMLTTVAILCHEVPHEVGDFVILLNSGFSWREAAKAQVITACGGFVGVIIGLLAEHMTMASSWLLPFTAGGFLYIALVSILPGLLEIRDGGQERRKWSYYFAEILSVVIGVLIMALVTVVEKESCGYVPTHLTGT